MRRYIRPFFLDPVSQQPLPSKKYYDVLSWLTTQFTFSFVVAPFIVLDFDKSMAVWSSVYFYAIIGTATSMAFFASPAKGHLRRMLEQRARASGGRLVRSASTDSLAGGKRPEPVLGINDPVKDIDEALQELRGEMEKKYAKRGTGEKADETKKGL